MKPYIFITKSPDKNGKFVFTEAELKKILEKVYDDGYNEGLQCYSKWWSAPITVTSEFPNIKTTPSVVPNPYQVTCDNTINTVGDQ